MTVNGWELIERIGSGGMGVVWRAEHPRHGEGALKLLREERLADPAARARFRREATALQQVDGLCTGRVLDVQLEGDAPYIVTEYVAGPTLAGFVGAQGPLAGDVLLAFALGLAEALVAVHQAGVVHRDLSPTNVLMAGDGPKVVDFGIARYADAMTVTRTGMAIGTPGWMSPEQLRGSEAGPAADMFCWALLVCYAASGHNPFGEGATDALLYRVVHEAPSVPPLPPQLESLVTRALAKDPSARPSALHVLTAIERDAGASTASVLRHRWQPPPVAMAEATARPAAPTPVPQPPLPLDAPPGWAATGLEPPRPRRSFPLRGWGLAGVAVVAAVVAVVAFLNAARDAGTTDTPTPAASERVDLAAGGGETPPPLAAGSGETEIPPPDPNAPPAPWDTSPVVPTGYLAEVAQAWAADARSCDLYAPTLIELLADARNGTPIEQVRPGWIWFGWNAAQGGSKAADAAYANVGIWPVDDPPGVVDLYLDSGRQPREYRDGSVMYFSDPVGTENGRLIAIAGQDCYYEVRASDGRTIGRVLGSLRPIIVE